MTEGLTGVGAIAWVDLTVPDAQVVRDFYHRVVGWTVTEVDLGGYRDYCMNRPDTGASVAGVCWARGSNADLPPQWLMYVTVGDLDESIQACVANGGAVVAGPKQMGSQGRYCVIRDPAGAVLALIQATHP